MMAITITASDSRVNIIRKVYVYNGDFGIEFTEDENEVNPRNNPIVCIVRMPSDYELLSWRIKYLIFDKLEELNLTYETENGTFIKPIK